MKVVFGSVVYKSAEKYLNDFLMSLQKQKESDFSIIIINDDIETKQLNNIFSNYLIEIECKKKENLTPIQLRVELLKQAKYENADLLILDDNPLNDLTALRNPKLVIKNGIIIKKKNKKYQNVEAALDKLL